MIQINKYNNVKIMWFDHTHLMINQKRHTVDCMLYADSLCLSNSKGPKYKFELERDSNYRGSN